MGASIAPETTAPQVDAALAAASLLKVVMGDGYPAQNADDATKVAFVDRMHAETEPEAVTRYKQTLLNVFYANGRQHVGWQKNSKVYDDLPLLPKENRVTMNYIRPILRSRSARIMSSPINFSVIPESNSLEHRDKGKVAVNWLKYRMRALQAEQRIRAGLMLAFCSGVGAFKTFWNPDIGTPKAATKFFPVAQPGPDGKPQIDPNGQVVTQLQEIPVDENGQPVSDESQAYMYRPGDTDFAIRSVFNLRWNSDAQGMTAGEGLRYMIDSDVVPLSVARSRFKRIAATIKPLAGNESFLTYERMAQASAVMKPQSQNVGVSANVNKLNNSELTVIREYWELESSFFPQGRVIVTVGGACAYDGPYPQGFFPYAPLYDEVAALSAGGRPCVNDMISPQDVINEQWAAIKREMKASAQGQFAAFNIPGLVDQLTSENDSVIRVPVHSQTMGRGIRDVVTRLDPSQVPSDRWKMIESALSTLYDIGAYHEISRGQIPPGLDSGVAIQQLQESESGQLKDCVDSLRTTILTLGHHQLQCAKFGYGDDETRILPVDRPDLRYTIDSITGSHLPDPERIGLELENFKPRSESAFKAEIMELFEKQVLDQRTALRMIDMGRGLEGALDSSTRDYAKARCENLAMQEGKVLVVPGNPETGVPTEVLNIDGSPMLYPDDDNHAIHIEVHYEIAKDVTQPWALRQVALFHVAAHRQAAMAQAMAQNPPQPQPASSGKEGKAA